MSAEFPLALVIKAVDKASGPLRAISERFAKLTDARKSFSKGLSNAGEALNLPGLGRGLAGFGGALRNVGAEAFSLGAKVVGMAAASGFALYSAIRSSVTAGDDLGTIADRVGLTVDAYASLRHAASMADVDQEEFNSAMDKLNKNMGDMKAGKGGEFLAFLNEISPTLARSMKGAKSTEEGLGLMTDALAKIPDTGRRAILSAHAFGKTGLQMGVWLHSGSAAIQAQQVAYMNLAGSQEAFVKVSGDLDDAMKENSAAFEGVRAVIGVGLFPVIKELTQALTKFLVEHRDGLKAWANDTGKAIKAWIDGGGIQRLIATLIDVATTIGKVVDWLGPMGVGLAAVGVLVLPLIASLGSLAVAGVTLAVEALPLLVAAVSFVAPAFIAAGTAVAGFALEIAPALLAIAPFIAAAVALVYLAKTIGDNWGDIALIFRDWGTSLKFAVLDAWQTVRPILEKLSMFMGGKNAFTALVAVGDAATAGIDRGTAAQAAPMVSTRNSSEARVEVNFSNLPKGARVSSDPTSSQPVDMSLGYSMGPT